MSIESVEPGGPADKAGIKAGDAVTEFDGERVRSVRQFLRLVQETTPGRSVPVVLSRAGQRVTVNITPERSTLSDDFGFRYARRSDRAPGDSTESADAAVRAIAPRAAETPGRCCSTCWVSTTADASASRVEDLDDQLAEYFGVKEGVLVKSVAR